MGRLIFTIIASFIVAVTSVRAEPITYGYDVLALAKYCDTYLRAPRLPALSTLLGTFGDPLPCIEKAIKQGGITDVQVDLIDATCWRNRKCGFLAPKPDDLTAIYRRARRVNELAVKYPAVQFWISPALEHDIKLESILREMFSIARRGCPTCEMINSPFKGLTIPGIPNERHGNRVKSFSVSNDGESLFDSNSVSYRKNGEVFVFAWWNRLNLRFTGEKTWIDPLERKCRPTLDEFKQAYLLFQEPEAKPVGMPPGCKSVRGVRAPEIAKVNSEDFCSNDPRSGKFVFISRIRDSKISVIHPSTGAEVGCLKYYGPYSGISGTYRHYIGTCSHQTPAMLYEDAGGEWIYLRRKNGECILVNSIRRLGSFR
jgi:hypothetical protein